MKIVARRLKASTIERRVAMLLVDFQAQFGRIKQPPVPVEEVLEGFLKLHLEYDNIQQRFGYEQVDGITIAETRQVIIDERLDPVEHPELEGRSRYTMAHEIGHVRLHPNVDIHALGTSKDPREVGDYREFERQADKFAAYLLMPEHLVRREWLQVFGTEAPLVISTEAEAAGTENLGSREAFLSAFAEFNSRQLADRFRVSVPAMRIRLQELSLLPRL